VRTAILTDVHGNRPALEAVLAECARLSADRHVCLGDTVGYGASPNECCRLVRERASFTLLGNHDAAVAGRMDYDYYYDAARDALDWTRKALDAENLAWLRSLPYTVREGRFEYCHGSPIEPEQYDYLFLTEQVEDLLPTLADLSDVTFVGHSHLPRAWAVRPGKVRELDSDEVALESGWKYIFGVGSTGQPRDGDPRACFALLDDEANLLTFHRAGYDVGAAADLIVGSGLRV